MPGYPIYLPPVLKHDAITTLSQTEQWGFRDFNIRQMWKQGADGSGVCVWVFDTGVAEHVDLIPGAAYDYVNGSGIQNSHGTHVAGIIAAQDNEFGVVGTSPKSKINSIRVIGNDGSGDSSGIDLGLTDLENYIQQTNNCNRHVVNMSLGSPQVSPSMYNLIKKLIYDYDVVFVCSAGNSGQAGDLNLIYPAKWDECIAVGSISANKAPSYFSSHGYMLDVPAICKYSKQNGSMVMLDGTVATPFLIKPLQQEDEDCRPDFLFHSYTKDITGSGDSCCFLHRLFFVYNQKSS